MVEGLRPGEGVFEASPYGGRVRKKQEGETELTASSLSGDDRALIRKHLLTGPTPTGHTQTGHTPTGHAPNRPHLSTPHTTQVLQGPYLHHNRINVKAVRLISIVICGGWL